MKNLLRIMSIILCLAMCMSIAVTADTDAADTSAVTDSDTLETTPDTAEPDTPDTPDSERVFHVKAQGAGDGSTADQPMSDIAEAFSLMPEQGGKIIVYGKYEITDSSRHDPMLGAFNEPEHNGKVTVTGQDAYLVFPENYQYNAGGAVTFENIGFSGSGTLVISARYNPLVMGEGISIIGISDGVTLVGGYNGSNSGIADADLTGDTSVEVYSGSYKVICGYNRTTTAKECTGSANVTVRGGNVNLITAGFSGYNNAFTDNAMAEMKVSVSGGGVYKISDVDMSTYGRLRALSLDYTGGEIRNIIISSEVESVISYTEEMSSHVTGFLRYFDRYRRGEGESVETEKIKVAFIGDSITAGTGTTDPATESYPAQLGQMLGDAYEVGNFSEGGRCVLANSGSPYFESEAFAHSLAFQPDVVCIMLGTNDLAALLSTEGAWETLYRDMLTLIEKYTALESKPIIYLLTPTVRTDDSALEGAIRDFMLPVYKQLSEDVGVGYVDLYTVSGDMKHHFGDSVHPDAVACSYLATWLYNAIVSNTNISSTVSDVSRVEVVLRREVDTTETETEPHREDNGATMWIAILIVLGCAATLTVAIIRDRGTKKRTFFDGKKK